MDLESCFARIKEVSHPVSRQFHKVHFTDHAGNPERPFDAIYGVSPHKYFETESLLNPNRPSENFALFRKHGLPATMAPRFFDYQISMARVEPYWKGFSPEDRGVHMAFLVA
jgi:hypothetical protein